MTASLPRQVTNGNYGGGGFGSGVNGSISVAAAGSEGGFINALDQDQLRDLFFGAPKPFSVSAPSDEYSVETRTSDFARMWDGQNPRIRQVIQRTIVESERIMFNLFPIRPLPSGTRSITVQRLIFDDHLLNAVPDFGTVRLTSNRWSSWSLKSERKGLGFMMEDGFAMTPIGYETYFRSIIQIANATIDSMQLNAIFRLLSVTGNNSETSVRTFGSLDSSTIEKQIENECGAWSIMTKSPDGLSEAIMHGRDALARRNVKDATVLLGPYNFMRGIRASQTNSGVYDFNKTGQRGVDTRLGLSEKPLAELGGISVFECPLFPIGEHGSLVDPMLAGRAIGEFFRAEVEFCATVPPEKYTSALRDVTVYDERRDMMVTIPISVALRASGIFYPDDNPVEEPTEIGLKFFFGCGSVGAYFDEIEQKMTGFKATFAAVFKSKMRNAETAAAAFARLFGADAAGEMAQAGGGGGGAAAGRGNGGGGGAAAAGRSNGGGGGAAAGRSNGGGGGAAAGRSNGGAVGGGAAATDSSSSGGAGSGGSSNSGGTTPTSSSAHTLAAARLAQTDRKTYEHAAAFAQRFPLIQRAGMGDMLISVFAACRDRGQAALTPLTPFATLINAAFGRAQAATPRLLRQFLRALQLEERPEKIALLVGDVQQLEPLFAANAQMTVSNARASEFIRDLSVETSKGQNTPVTLDNMFLLLNRVSFSRAFFKSLIANDLPFPIDFLYARPLMRYVMGSAVLTTTDVGISYFGDADFQLSNDGVHKVLHGNFTCNLASAITRPEAVWVMPTAVTKSYEGGGGTDFYDPLNAQEVADFRNSTFGEKSMFCIPRIPGDGFGLRQYSDMTGAFPPFVRSALDNPDARQQFRRPHAAMLPIIAQHWGFSHQHFVGDKYLGTGPIFSDDPMSAQIALNTVICQGQQFMPRFNGEHFVPEGGSIAGTGHWGMKCYTGCRAHRQGLGGGLLDLSSMAVAQKAMGSKVSLVPSF